MVRDVTRLRLFTRAETATQLRLGFSDFNSPSRQEITNAVGVAKKEADITKVLDIMARPDAPYCFAAAINTAIAEAPSEGEGTIPKDTKYGKASVNPLSFESLGDRTVAYRITVPATAKGLDLNVYVDIVIVQKGRVGITLSATDTFTPVSTATSTSLLRKVLARVPGR